MSHARREKKAVASNRWGWCMLVMAMLLTCAVYSMGLSGAYIFDDYPNIVDNHAVQPTSASVSSLVGAALSSSSSDFKRPLASLSFAANFLITGLNPYWMKLTNLVIHLLNGLLVFLLARLLLRSTSAGTFPMRGSLSSPLDKDPPFTECAPSAGGCTLETQNLTGVVAALIAASWMLLPINLTGVLYVVQRMESMANLFVLVGLIGYVVGRRCMIETYGGLPVQPRSLKRPSLINRYFLLCFVSITVPTALGILAKETAVMLPLYALLVEWAVFRFAKANTASASVSEAILDRGVFGMFLLIVLVPLVGGLVWLLPGVLKPATWATRDFTLGTRLLSETRIIIDYIVWTLLPTPHALSFYHDNFHISTGLLSPVSTLVSMGLLGALITLMFYMRTRRPLVALGLALFFGCHLLTGTIIPLELVYEHRNYFASFGLLLMIVPLLTAPNRQATPSAVSKAAAIDASPNIDSTHTGPMISSMGRGEATPMGALPMALPRYALLAGLMICWASLTALTSYAWGDPLRLAEDLASRAPRSPRAQYELGRTYIIYSHYDPASPFTKLAYKALEKAAALPESSILPEQALIFMNARMKLPLKNAWWDSMITKLMAHKPGVQDESSLDALTQCDREHHCDLPNPRMTQAYLAALSHPNPSARLLAMYGDYAWNILDDHNLGERMISAAVQASPTEPAYQISLVRMLAAANRSTDAKMALDRLQRLNIGGRLDASLAQLKTLQALQ
jgi:hypothetical protein